MNGLSLIDALFDEQNFGCRTCGYTPSVDVRATKDVYVLEMDLPGKTEADIDITLKDGVLTIASVKKENAPAEKRADAAQEKWLLRERTAYSFSRSFTLPEDTDMERISASFKNGVLTVTMRRNEAMKKEKKIAIQVA